MWVKNSIDTIWNRTSDLPICSAAPSPLCYCGPSSGSLVKQRATSSTRQFRYWSPLHHKNITILEIHNAVGPKFYDSEPLQVQTSRRLYFVLRMYTNICVFVWDPEGSCPYYACEACRVGRCSVLITNCVLCFVLYCTELFEMMVGVLTTCHTQYTWDRSICVFLFKRTTLQVFVTYLIGALYVFY